MTDEDDLRDRFAAAALTGLIHSQDLQAGPLRRELACTMAYRWADAMLRERAKTNHDAAPAARARTNAAGISRQGTGETPVTENMPKEKRAEVSVSEPVAWAVCCPGDGDWSPCFFHEPHAQRHASAIFGSKNIVPLYRSPTLTDAEREAVEQAIDAANGMGQAEPWTVRTLRGLLERLK